MDREELAWAAGFFDGEGCTSNRRHTRGRNYAAMSIAQIDRDVLDRFVGAIGCGKVNGPYANRQSSRPNSQPRWRVDVVAHRDVTRIFELLRPWLGRVKIEQAERAIAADTRGRVSG